MTTIQGYAQAVVEADVALFATKHIISRLLEVDPNHGELPALRLTEIREQLILNGAIALLGTCAEAYDENTVTEDGKVVRAYVIAAGS